MFCPVSGLFMVIYNAFEQILTDFTCILPHTRIGQQGLLPVWPLLPFPCAVFFLCGVEQECYSYFCTPLLFLLVAEESDIRLQQYHRACQCRQMILDGS